VLIWRADWVAVGDEVPARWFRGKGWAVRTPHAHLESRRVAVGDEVPAHWFREKECVARTLRAHLESGWGSGGWWWAMKSPVRWLEGRGALCCENPLCSFRADGAVVGVDG
jgi:hypothetical protein